MRILAFDTATSATAVALCADQNVFERRDLPPAGERPRHATALLPLIAEVMDAAEVGWEQVDRIAVGLGPGTFTGLRIGVATAKALAQASGIALVGVSTLHSLALGARGTPVGEADVVAAVLDARRGEVYAAAWDAASLPGDPVLGPGAFPPESIAGAMAGLGSAPVAIGEGAIAFRDVLERGGISVPPDASDLHRVTAAGHCLIARHRPATDPSTLTPDYQRLPDAQPRSTAPVGPDRPDER